MTAVTPDSPLFPPLRPDLEYASPGNQETDAQNQRQAWLRQMELSQMSMLQADGNVKEGRDETEAHTGGQTQQSQTGNQASALLPIHPIVQTSKQEQTGAAQSTAEPVNANNDGTAAAPTNTQAAQQATTERAIFESGMAKITAPASKNGNASDDDTSNAAGVQTAVIPFQENTLVLPASPGAVPSDIAGATTQTPQQSVTAAGAITPRAAALGGAANEAGGPQAEEVEASEGTAQHANAKQESSAGQAWQKRAMHVAQNGRDVSVTIRDSALDERQSAQIVARMAGDAAQSGLRVRNAVVNGKTVLKLQKEDSSESPSADGANHPLAANLFSSYDTQEQ